MDDLSNSIIVYFNKDIIKNINSFTTPAYCIPDAKVYSIIIPFCIIDNLPFVLVEKRSAFVKQPFELSFPGGQKEEHEKSALIAALRECEEEIGLNAKSFLKIKYCGIFANLKTVIYVFSGLIKQKISEKIKSQILFKSCETILTKNKKQNSNPKITALKINKNEVEKVILFPFDIITKPPKIFDIEYKGYIENLPKNENLKNIINKSYLKEGFYLPYTRTIRYWEYDSEVLWGYSADIVSCVVRQIIKYKNEML